MKYIDASAMLRILFAETGESVPLDGAQRLITSQLIEVETFRAVDRARLVGHLDDRETAFKRKELADALDMMDLVPINSEVIRRARDSFGVVVRALDAIHVATAELLKFEAPGEPLEFWTHDQRQATAALSRGLTVRGI